ncbi:tetratricopeptide repeat protein [Komagataeibacter sp. SM21]|uniref:tetratricopeptide repeat protein n=1 Tax=Komagataeibacter sp. SM21 TaxID=3242899 RepID=UPI003528AB78
MMQGSHDREGRLAQGHAALLADDIVTARACFAQLQGMRGDDPDALHGLACVALAIGRADVAIGLAGRALRIAPRGQYHVVLARALLVQGHHDAARAAMNIACLSHPDDVAIMLCAADMMESTGDTLAAARAYARVVSLAGPHDGDSRALHARFLWRRGRRTAACAQMRQAVRLAPGRAEYLHELVEMLLALGARKEAETLLRAHLEHDPHDGVALSQLGALLFAGGHMRDAVDRLQRAMDHAPSVEACNNLGLARMALGDMAGADAALRQAMHMQPSDARIALNHATGLFEGGQPVAARVAYDAILATTPPVDEDTQARARFNMGVALLACGEMEQGWTLWESRLAFLPPHPSASHLPRWNGRVFAGGGKVLVHLAQGLGDVIHFLRYVPLAAQRAPIVLAVPQALRRLVHTLGCATANGVDYPIEIIAPDEYVNMGITSQCDLFSLPHVLGGAQMPAFNPYLGEKPWRTHKRTKGPLRIGLCHAGNPAYRFDARRSVPVAALAPLTQVTGVEFISVQPRVAEGVQAGFVRHSLAPDADLLDTAHLITTLDLVISVDTLAAHLAGAMGCPVWLLNRFGGDWRWYPAFDLDGPEGVPPGYPPVPDGCPRSRWYPSLWQFRQGGLQPPDQAWGAVMTAVSSALQAWIAGRETVRS